MERRYDENEELKFNPTPEHANPNNPNDPLQISTRSIIRSRAKKLTEALSRLVQDVWEANKFKDLL